MKKSYLQSGSRNPTGFINKKLYNAAMQLTAKHLRKDSEEVKAVRDAYTQTYFNKTYDVMSFDEKNDCVNIMLERVKVSDFITVQQKKKLWVEMIRYALVYADFKKITYVNKETGEVFTGTGLQETLQMQFENKEKIPESVIYELCKKCINTKSNRFLIEGGYKNYSKAENHCDYNRLSYDSAQYLINRYQAMNAEVEKRLNYNRNTGKEYEFQLN